jgi:large subunit ribosomal protein L18
MYAQVIDDDTGRTLIAASTLEPALKLKINGKGKVAAATLVGEELAKKAMGYGIKTVVFDRGGYKYHGRVKAVAEAAREAGLEF